MAEKKRLSELSVLNLLFCFMVLWSHCSGQPVKAYSHTHSPLYDGLIYG